jgi:hypothetical protein
VGFVLKKEYILFALKAIFETGESGGIFYRSQLRERSNGTEKEYRNYRNCKTAKETKVSKKGDTNLYERGEVA